MNEQSVCHMNEEKVRTYCDNLMLYLITSLPMDHVAILPCIIFVSQTSTRNRKPDLLLFTTLTFLECRIRSLYMSVLHICYWLV